MMPLFYRLRRSVALFVCPELSAEARLKATLAEARAMRAPAESFCLPDTLAAVITNQASLASKALQDAYSPGQAGER